jgi:hypothetical protein
MHKFQPVIPVIVKVNTKKKSPTQRAPIHVPGRAGLKFYV